MPTGKQQDAWLIRRDTNDLTIVVSANYIPRLEVFGVSCKVNGVPYDTAQSEDPVQTALAMIGAAVAETVDAVPEIKEETPAPRAVAA